MAKRLNDSESGVAIEDAPETHEEPAKKRQAMLVWVAPAVSRRDGSEVFDGFTRWMRLDEAIQYDPNLASLMTVPLPKTSGKPEPTAQDIFEEKKYRELLAGVPEWHSIERYHGQSFRSPGFYVVYGEHVAEAYFCVERNMDGKYADAPDTEWHGPYPTAERARVENDLPEFPIGPAQSPGDPVVVKLQQQKLELERRLAVAEGRA